MVILLSQLPHVPYGFYELIVTEYHEEKSYPYSFGSIETISMKDRLSGNLFYGYYPRISHTNTAIVVVSMQIINESSPQLRLTFRVNFSSVNDNETNSSIIQEKIEFCIGVIPFPIVNVSPVAKFHKRNIKRQTTNSINGSIGNILSPLESLSISGSHEKQLAVEEELSDWDISPKFCVLPPQPKRLSMSISKSRPPSSSSNRSPLPNTKFTRSGCCWTLRLAEAIGGVETFPPSASDGLECIFEATYQLSDPKEIENIIEDEILFAGCKPFSYFESIPYKHPRVSKDGDLVTINVPLMIRVHNRQLRTGMDAYKAKRGDGRVFTTQVITDGERWSVPKVQFKMNSNLTMRRDLKDFHLVSSNTESIPPLALCNMVGIYSASPLSNPSADSGYSGGAMMILSNKLKQSLAAKKFGPYPPKSILPKLRVNHLLSEEEFSQSLQSQLNASEYHSMLEACEDSEFHLAPKQELIERILDMRRKSIPGTSKLLSEEVLSIRVCVGYGRLSAFNKEPSKISHKKTCCNSWLIIVTFVPAKTLSAENSFDSMIDHLKTSFLEQYKYPRESLVFMSSLPQIPFKPLNFKFSTRKISHSETESSFGSACVFFQLPTVNHHSEILISMMSCLHCFNPPGNIHLPCLKGYDQKDNKDQECPEPIFTGQCDCPYHRSLTEASCDVMVTTPIPWAILKESCPTIDQPSSIVWNMSLRELALRSFTTLVHQDHCSKLVRN